MKLEYLDDINDGGKYTGVEIDHLIRLYEFDKNQAVLLRQSIYRTILTDKKSLNLNDLDFIEAINCNLTLRLSDEDLGIFPSKDNILFCDLTIAGYQKMLDLMQPFCEKETTGYQWLYDLDNETEFLFSPNGKW